MRRLLTSRTAIALAIVLAAGAAVRFATLGHQSYDHDEAATLLVLRPGLGATWHAIVSMERTPPLYYLLAWPWSKLGGTGEVGLRSLSALVGTLTVPAAFLAARELAGRRAGLVAAALVAFNPYLVWYSQEARSYALLACLTAWGLYLFLLAARDPSRRNVALWALASALALASHYFAAFLVAPEAVLLLRFTSPRRRAALACGALLAVAGALAPLAIAQAGNGGGPSLFTRWTPASALFDAIVELGGSAEPHGLEGTPGIQILRAVGLIVTLAAVAVGLTLFARRAWPAHERRHWMLAAVLAAGFAGPFAVGLLGLNYVDPRNLIGCVVPLLIAVAAGLAASGAPRLARLAAAAWTAGFAAVLALVWASPQLQRPDWRAIAQATEPDRGATVLVVPHKGLFALSHYVGALRFIPGHFHGGVLVRTIDVIESGIHVAAPPGFRPAGERLVGGSVGVQRFTARRPVDVRPREIAGIQLLDRPSNALVEGSPSAAHPS